MVNLGSACNEKYDRLLTVLLQIFCNVIFLDESLS